MGERFRSGEKVLSTSGGPDLVVEGYDSAGRVVCSYWYKGERARASLEEVDLVRGRQDQGPNLDAPVFRLN